MSVFPDVEIASIKIDTVYDSIATRMKTGWENITAHSLLPKRVFTIGVGALSLTGMKSVLNHFNNTCKGAKHNFLLKLETGETRIREYVAMGDGSTTTFNLSCMGASSVAIYVSGTAETHVVVSSGAGTDGVDQLIVSSGYIPAAGTLIKASFIGTWAPVVRYDHSMNERYLLYDLLESRNIVMIEDR